MTYSQNDFDKAVELLLPDVNKANQLLKGVNRIDNPSIIKIFAIEWLCKSDDERAKMNWNERLALGILQEAAQDLHFKHGMFKFVEGTGSWVKEMNKDGE